MNEFFLTTRVSAVSFQFDRSLRTISTLVVQGPLGPAMVVDPGASCGPTPTGWA
jgi:hypothetical protein